MWFGEASREDVAFVNRELAAPVNVQALAKQVPKRWRARSLPTILT
jgi:hypothetical protein